MRSSDKSTPNFGEATSPFVAAGIFARALLPIAPVDARISDVGDLKEDVLGKAPGRFSPRHGDWRGLGGKYVIDGVPRQDADRFASWPTPNVGLIARYAPAIDSDAESQDARRLIERALDTAFGNAPIAERLRGDGPRRLYAFRCADPADPDKWVRTRRVSYRLKGDDEHAKPHKLDIQGAGTQYLIAGRHQSGDEYRWHPDWGLCELFRDKLIEKIDNSDIERFLEAFKAELAENGGEIISSTGGHAPGDDRDYSDQEPIFAVREIFDGLDRIPNSADNFETRDEFVGMLASIRAALGSEAEAEREQVEAWACEDPTWCPPEYFEKCWDSLNRAVRVDRHALDRIFRRSGVFTSAKAEFAESGEADQAGVKSDKAKRKEARGDVLADVASRYVIGLPNTDTDDGSLRMRANWDPAVEFVGLNWWQFKSAEPNTSIIVKIHENYSPDEKGFWNFVRDLRRKHSCIFYTGKTRHPNFDRGDIVREENPDGTFTQSLNVRFLSPVIRHARNLPKDTRQAREDVATVLDFVKRIFGELSNYELDTLAYMAQSGRRPGHMLLLVGETGVGKSTYIQMLISMFDGIGKDMGGQIDGTKMTNEAARRFALAKTEGCRIISIKELPEGSSAKNMAAVTSSIKQIVDPGVEGDFYQIERKGQDSRSVRNFARVVASSNYNNSLLIEENDRRIFYVRCQIDLDNKPGSDFYANINDVTGNPSRLAAFWRYLLDRDVSNYAPAKAPPVSREKREAQIAGVTDPLERHTLAAIEVLRAGKRWIFDLKEFGRLMTAMSENEYINTNETVDNRRDYDFGKMPSAVKRLERYATKIRVLKSNGERVATVYGLRTARPSVEALTLASGRQILDVLERDRENRLSPDHVWSAFAGPLKPAGGCR